MSFSDRSEFIRAQTSEKTVLAHIHATSRLFTWSLETGAIYQRDVEHFVYDLKQDQIELTQVFTHGALVAGSYFYDIMNNKLYVWAVGSVNPATVQMIVTYRFFFSNSTMTASWNLENDGAHVLYEGRINKNPGFKSLVGIEQSLSSITGQGDLVLENTDSGLDSVFESLIWDNQLCFIYSYNKDLDFDESKIIYRGRVSNKSFDEAQITFTIKDQFYDLDQMLNQGVYNADDGVNPDIQGVVKRWIYGKVDGLQCQSLDQIGNGYQLTGTVSATIAAATLTGTGTLFLTEVSPNDDITIGTQNFTVESVESNTSLTLNDNPESDFSAATAILQPDLPVTFKNRTFLVADHACSRLARTITSIPQLNRLELNSTDGLYAGDFLTLDTTERVEIDIVHSSTRIVLTQNLLALPTIGSDVVRDPIQNVYILGKRVLPENYTIENLGAPDNHLKITLSQDAEFVIAHSRPFPINMTWTNGSRTVTTADTIDLTEYFKARDWIKPDSVGNTTYYEILQVEEQTITLRVAYAEITTTDTLRARIPDYVADDTPVSVLVLGKTETGEPDGTWLRFASQVVKNMCVDSGFENFNEDTFEEAEQVSRQLISLALPVDPTSGLTSAKNAIDLVNKSVYGSLSIDKNLDLQYRILKNDVPVLPVIIRDSDVISWKVKTTNGKNFRNVIVKYRFEDYNRTSLSASNEIASYSSDFVRDYVGTDQTATVSCYLYDAVQAEIMAHRYVYFNRLGRSDFTIDTDLRFEDVNIGDTIQVEFSRLYQRFGGDDARKKLLMVVGLTKSGEDIQIQATDLNNTFSTSCVITPNDAPDFVDADSDQRLRYGYITSDQGIVNNDETTANVNLIS